MSGQAGFRSQICQYEIGSCGLDVKGLDVSFMPVQTSNEHLYPVNIKI